MSEPFDETLVEAAAAVEEVDVESHRPDGRVRRTTVWIVVDGGKAYVRSVRGRAGIWYRELRADSAGALHVGGRRVPVRAVPVEDPGEIDRVTEAYRRKYGRSPYLGGVVRPESLSGTLRLESAG